MATVSIYKAEARKGHHLDVVTEHFHSNKALLEWAAKFQLEDKHLRITQLATGLGVTLAAIRRAVKSKKAVVPMTREEFNASRGLITGKELAESREIVKNCDRIIEIGGGLKPGKLHVMVGKAPSRSAVCDALRTGVMADGSKAAGAPILVCFPFSSGDTDKLQARMAFPDVLSAKAEIDRRRLLDYQTSGEFPQKPVVISRRRGAEKELTWESFASMCSVARRAAKKA